MSNNWRTSHEHDLQGTILATKNACLPEEIPRFPGFLQVLYWFYWCYTVLYTGYIVHIYSVLKIYQFFMNNIPDETVLCGQFNDWLFSNIVHRVASTRLFYEKKGRWSNDDWNKIIKHFAWTCLIIITNTNPLKSVCWDRSNKNIS